MYVTHRSFAAPAPAIREFFSGYTIHIKEMLYAVRCLKSNENMILALAGQFKQHILYYAGVSIMPPRVLAKTLRGQKLATGNIIPVFKKCSQTCLSNYRPSSLLSVFHIKLLEKLMYNR